MRKMHNHSKVFQEGMRDSIPIALGYFAVSFAFGMLAVSGGMKIGHAVLISVTNVTSAGQFAALDIIFGDGSYWEMALTQLVINLRYMLMSFSLSQKLESGTSRLKRAVVAFGVTDEIFGISAARPGKVSPYYNMGAMAVAIPGWTLGTLAGAVLGNVLPEMIISALSIALYGMFLAIIIPPSKEHKEVALVVVISMLLSTAFALLPVLKKISSGFVIIMITVAVSAVAAILHPVSEEEEEAVVQEETAEIERIGEPQADMGNGDDTQ